MIKYNIGFMLLSINNDSYHDNIFQNIKQLINKNSYSNICIFSSNCDKVDTYNIPILHLSHSKFFYGCLWMFDIPSLLIAKNFSNIKQKILYVKDTPWMNQKNSLYKEWRDIYTEDVEFVASDQSTYDIYDICWKTPLTIMKNFNHEEIQNIIQPTI